MNNMLDLVSWVDQQLSKHNFNMLNFTEIAYDALGSINEKFVIDLLASIDLQHISLIHRLFENDFYYINLHSWPDAITNCHCHEFSGAFRVIKGSAFHLHWAFKNSTEVTPFLYKGELELISKEVINFNKTQKIFVGQEAMIHQMIYIDRPTVTLVLRSKSDPRYSMDEFFYPGLKIKLNSSISIATSELASCKTKDQVFKFIDSSREDILLFLYSGAFGSNSEFLRGHFEEYKLYIENQLLKHEWFSLYLDYTLKHRQLINKLIQASNH